MNSRILKPIVGWGSHDFIMSIFNGFRRGTVLDAPCGHGALSVRLREQGFSVSCCDIDPELMQAEGFENRKVDLNTGRIDYDDGSFDYITCVNGLHRLYNIENAVKEFSRVLKTNGRIVISIPNYTNILRRIRFLMTGIIGHNIIKSEFIQVSDAPQAHFRNPLTIQQIHFTLLKYDFHIEGLSHDNRKVRTILLYPLGILMRVLSSIVYFRRYSDYGMNLSNALPVLLGGRHVYVVAVKKST